MAVVKHEHCAAGLGEFLCVCVEPQLFNRTKAMRHDDCRQAACLTFGSIKPAPAKFAVFTRRKSYVATLEHASSIETQITP
jgi:hypothetical protein